MQAGLLLFKGTAGLCPVPHQGIESPGPLACGNCLTWRTGYFSLLLGRNVQRGKRKVCVLSDGSISLGGVQGPKALGSGVQGDEPPMTACDGNFIGGEISRNKQSPKELRRLRLRIEEDPCPVSFDGAEVAKYL